MMYLHEKTAISMENSKKADKEFVLKMTGQNWLINLR